MTTLTNYKRYRMEIDLCDLPPLPVLAAGFSFLSWHEVSVEDHAYAKYLSFQGEIDSVVFSNLGHLDGCLQLMKVIRAKENFCPQATWLLEGPDGACGTIQGVIERGIGSIQNVGVMPEYRGRGLGTALVLKALHSFYQEGLVRAGLEVTARNFKALRLYRRLGFYVRKTLFREIEIEPIPDDVMI